jgi:DNA-binding XRE family transcriptional regulator
MGLKAVRIRAGVSQAELAMAAGVGVDTIRKIEQGIHVPNLATAKKLADTLGALLQETPSKILGELAEQAQEPTP